MICFYILKSLKDNRRYLGSTKDLDRRLKEHQSGMVKSTRNRRPLVLLGYQICNTVQEATGLEKSIREVMVQLKEQLRMVI